MQVISGPTPWAIVLCKFSDVKDEPQTPQFFEDLFVNPGKGGLYDYWRDVSYGVINLNGSAVFGWFDLPYTIASDQQRDRYQRITAAINAVKDEVDFSPYYGIVVILNTPIDGGSIGIQQLIFGKTTKNYGLIVADSNAWNNTFLAHEMGHSYGFDHSFNTNPISFDPGSDNRPGAYGDGWDIMSAFNFGRTNPTFEHPRFGPSGPGLTAVYHFLFGWIQGNIFNVDMTFGDQSHTVILSALNQNDTSANLFAVITYAGSATTTWTVEYRRRAGWDAGINSESSPGVVLIHENRNGMSYLLQGKNGNVNLQVGDVFEGPSFTVGVVHIDSVLGRASILIKTRPMPPLTRPNPCGFLRRNIQSQTRLVSQLSRHLRSATSPEDREELSRQLDEELAQMDGLLEDFRARGCSD